MGELSSNRTGENDVQIETENEKFTGMCSRSPQNHVFGNYTLLFGRARYGEEMYQNFKTHLRDFVFLIKSHCFVTLS